MRPMVVKVDAVQCVVLLLLTAPRSFLCAWNAGRVRTSHFGSSQAAEELPISATRAPIGGLFYLASIISAFYHDNRMDRMKGAPRHSFAPPTELHLTRVSFFFSFFLNSSSSRKSFKPQIPHSILSHDTHPSSLWSKRPDCSNPLPLPNPISASPHDSTTTGPADERPLMAKVTARDLLPCSAPLPCSSARRSASRRLPLQIQIQWNVRCYNSFLFICQMLVASCLSVPQDESTISHSSHPCPRHPCAPSK